jgi:tetratricopeptide (TPR) repeat protein
LKIYSAQRNRAAFDNLMQDSLRLAYNDDTARRYLEERANAEKKAAAAAPPGNSPEAMLNLSAKYCNDRNYQGCIDLAKKALELRPNYAEAYNNLAAGYSSLEKWDDAIKAAREAIRLKPDYELAKKNLEWAVAHKAQSK